MEEKQDTIDILIKCPKHIYTEIEEICINNGINPTKYFMNLHGSNGSKVKEELKKYPELPSEENELPTISTTGMPDKFYKKKEKKK